MKFLILNVTNEVKSICRFGGKKVNILPNNYIEFEPNNSLESTFWANISRLNTVPGIDVVVDERKQQLIKKLKKTNQLGSINTVNTKVTNSTELTTTIEETVSEPVNNEPLPEIENAEEIISNEQIFNEEVNEIITDNTTEDETNESIATDTIDDVETTSVKDDINTSENDVVETVVETAEDSTNKDTMNEDNITEDVETVETNVESDEINETHQPVKYSEEELNNMTKAELQAILNDINVTYRKNATNATLINLILEYYNNSED